jgi:hypothetical protein
MLRGIAVPSGQSFAITEHIFGVPVAIGGFLTGNLEEITSLPRLPCGLGALPLLLVVAHVIAFIFALVSGPTFPAGLMPEAI